MQKISRYRRDLNVLVVNNHNIFFKLRATGGDHHSIKKKNTTSDEGWWMIKNLEVISNKLIYFFQLLSKAEDPGLNIDLA